MVKEIDIKNGGRRREENERIEEHGGDREGGKGEAEEKALWEAIKWMTELQVIQKISTVLLRRCCLWEEGGV